MELRGRQEVRTFLQRLCEVLVERCGSQTAAAKAVGSSRREFIRWLAGESTPSARYFRLIEAACERLQIKSSDASRAASTLLERHRQGPLIDSVRFEAVGGRQVYGTTSYVVVVRGHGFGFPPRRTPFAGFSNRFRVSNNAQLGFGEYGYLGDHKKLFTNDGRQPRLFFADSREEPLTRLSSHCGMNMAVAPLGAGTSSPASQELRASIP